MKITQQYAHGGDVQFYQIEELPTRLKKLEKPTDKILARGETSGHCHILTGDVELYNDGSNYYAVVGPDGAYHQHYREENVTEDVFQVNKNISDCDHTNDCRLVEGIYAIGIDQQYDPHEGVWTRNLD